MKNARLGHVGIKENDGQQCNSAVPPGVSSEELEKKAQIMIEHRRLKTIADIIAILFILAFCLSGILTLTEYGMTWDEAYGNFFFGERYLHYFSSFDQSYLNFNDYLSMHKERPLDLYKSIFRDRPYEFPALADTASAATMYLFSYGLGWMDPVDGFHLFTILLVSSFLFVNYFFVSKRLGIWIALFSVFFMGTFPRLWGDMHFNVKDVPEMVFFGLALLTYWYWFEKPSWTRAVMVGVAAGAALGVKANAIILPVIFVLGFWPINPKELWHHIKSQYLKYIVMFVSGLITYFLSWPYIFTNPLNAQKYFSYIFHQGARAGSTTWNWQPLSLTTAVIPEVMLFCLIIGIIFSIRQIIKKEVTAYRLALMWLFIPILRISIPPSVNFDGIRHFLEFVPGAALVAGIGAAAIVKLFGKHNAKSAFYVGIILFLLISINTGLIIKQFGPYQNIYFNTIYGGLPGGKIKFGPDEATDYWGSSYRKGIEWLNQNAEQDSLIYVPVAWHIIDLVEPIWLREDIGVIPWDRFSDASNEGKPVYIMFVTRPGFYDDVARDCVATQATVYDIRVQNVPILEVYKK